MPRHGRTFPFRARFRSRIFKGLVGVVGAASVLLDATGVGASIAAGTGTASAAFSTAGASGSAGSASVVVAASGVGASTAASTGSASFAFSTAGVGVGIVPAVGAASGAFDATGTGRATAEGVGAAPFAFAASGVGDTASATGAGTGSAACAFAGSAVGASTASAVGTAAYAFAGAAIPAGTTSAAGSASFAYAGAGTGAATGAAVGTASAVFGASGTSAGVTASTGTASAAFTGTSAGSRLLPAVGSASAAFASAGVASAVGSATGAASATFAGTGASGVSGAASVVFTASAVASAVASSAGSAVFAFVGLGSTIPPIVAVGETIAVPADDRVVAVTRDDADIVDRAAYRTRVVDDGASAYWPLDDPAGSLTAHEIVGSATGTITGTVALGTAGPADASAMTFGGAGWIVVPAITWPTSVTLEALVRVVDDGEERDHLIIGIKPATGDVVWFGITTAFNSHDVLVIVLYIQVQTPALTRATIHGDATVTANTWHHVAVTFDATTGFATLYLDGVVDVADTLAHATPSVGGGSQIAAGVGGNDPWLGSLADVAVYPRVLTADEIAAHAALRTGARPTRVVVVDDDRTIEIGATV